MNEVLNQIIMMIEQGYTNEDIINKRLSYLSSEEYKNTKLKNIREQEKLIGTDIGLGDSNNVIFYDGYIDSNYVISHRSGTIDWCGGYVINNNVLEYLLNYLRKNIDEIKNQKGISVKTFIGCIRKYFEKSEDCKYFGLIDVLESFYKIYNNNINYNNSQLFIRYELPEIICSFNASNYNGKIEDYAKLYLNSWIDEKIKKEFQAIKHDDEKLFTVLDISELRRTGAVACTEYSMLMQNYLCFLGYHSFLIGAKVNGGGHNFNVIFNNGKYKIVDVGQLVSENMPNINEPYELLTFGEFSAKNFRKREMNYESEFNEKKIK